MATDTQDFLNRIGVAQPVQAIQPATFSAEKPSFDFIGEPVNSAFIPEDTLPELERQQDQWLQNNTSWSFKGAAQTTGRVIARTPVRIADDVANLISDSFFLDEHQKWEDKWFEEPKGAVEDIATDVTSWIGTFFLPGGVAAKGATALGKTSKAQKIAGFIGQTERGRKALKVSKIAGEGAAAGFVADFITADTENTVGTQALMERTQAGVMGLAIGAGVNLGLHGAGKIASVSLKKWRALRKVRQAAEGKADPTEALQSLKEAIQEENAIKNDILADIGKTDDGVKEIDLDYLDSDGAAPPPELSLKVKVVPEKKKPIKKKSVKQEMLKIQDFIERGQGLPDQLDRLVQLNKATGDRLNPMLSDLVKALGEAMETPSKVGSVRELVQGMELDLHRYRKLIELNTKAGNLGGKVLSSFKGNGADFSKPFKYKAQTLVRINQIDSLLELIKKTKNAPAFDKELADGIQKEITELVNIQSGKQTLSEVLDKKFTTSRGNATTAIWTKYKDFISKNVQEALIPSKEKQRASMEIFSDRVSRIISEAVAPDKKIAKEADKALKQATDILDNPSKYKESLEQVIADIEASDKIPQSSKDNAIETLTDLLEGNVGKTLFEGLPQHAKLIKGIIKEELGNIGKTLRQAIKEGREEEILEEVVENVASKTELGDYAKSVLIDNIRAELGNAITAIKDKTIRDFINKELYRKFNLHEELDNLYDLQDKSLEEIREYLTQASKKRKPTPEDIKVLEAQVRSAKKELEIRSENAFVKELLERLSALPQYSGPIRTDHELHVAALEKLRVNFMLSKPKTWLVGIPSGMLMLVYQPFKRAMSEFFKEVGVGFDNLSDFSKVQAGLQRAANEFKATIEYTSNFTDALALMKQAGKEGRPIFNPRSLRRFEEDLVREETGSLDRIRIPIGDRKKLKELIQRYGIKNKQNENAYRSWLNDMVEGTPTTRIGKMTDPLFSISFRMMGMFDEPLKFLGTMRALRADALQQAMTEGLEGKALEEFVDKHMAEAVQRVDGLPLWQQNEKFDQIEQLGQAITFQEEYADKVISKLAKSFAAYSRSGQDAAYRADKIAARFFVPFIKTPATIAQFTVDHMPGFAQFRSILHLAGKSKGDRLLKSKLDKQEDLMNLLKEETRPDKIRKTKESLEEIAQDISDMQDLLAVEKAEAVAQGITSTVMISSMIWLVQNAKMTGQGVFLTDDQKRRMLDAGWRPNSIEINGKLVDYSKFEPFATLLSVTADFLHYGLLRAASGEHVLEDEIGITSAIWASFTENFTNKYFIRGLSDLLKATTEESTNVENLIASQVASFSPGVLRDMAQINDPYQTYANDWQARLKERMAGIHPGGYRRNLLGEKVERIWSKEGAFGLISPVVWSDLPNDDVLLEIAGVRGAIGQSRIYRRQGIDSRNYKDADGQTLYDAWMEKMSTIKIGKRTVRQALEREFRLPYYKNAPIESFDGTETRRDIIAKVLSDYRKEAWEYMLDKHPRRFSDNDGNIWTDRRIEDNIYADDIPNILEIQKF